MSEIDENTGNAIIRRADLGFRDGAGGIRTSFLHLEGEAWGQGFGGFGLGGPYTDAWVYGILETLEVDSWDKLPGQLVRFRRDGRSAFGGTIVAIGHPIKDRWFNPKEAFAALKAGTP